MRDVVAERPQLAPPGELAPQLAPAQNAAIAIAANVPITAPIALRRLELPTSSAPTHPHFDPMFRPLSALRAGRKVRRLSSLRSSRNIGGTNHLLFPLSWDAGPGHSHGGFRVARCAALYRARVTPSRHVRDWEELAELDPLWAVLSDPAHAHGRWPLEEFFATGEGEVAGALEVAAELGLPQAFGDALDFGCGLGRLTRALGARFRRCVGVDVSARMVERARELNADVGSCEFVTTDADDLASFESGAFDLVYSSIVLQHLPSTDRIERYVGEFIRLLRPSGVAIFQIPAALPPRHRLQPRRRLYAALRRVGVPPARLYRAGLNPIRITALSEVRTRAVVERAGGIVARTVADDAVPPLPSRRYFATRRG